MPRFCIRLEIGSILRNESIWPVPVRAFAETRGQPGGGPARSAQMSKRS